ncbi:MAG TPA: efflux transporter outer membrane subunit [Alphaproteobacteria bacterium]|nr:efflux transporter outer membrane subunit [Alphaproteobacteria bacterium]
MMSTFRISLASATLLLLAGCSFVPFYEPPTVQAPAFKEAPQQIAADQRWTVARPSEETARGEWWKVFADPALDGLEAQAMQANWDLKAAAARLRQARALRGVARSEQFPTLDAGFGPTYQRRSPDSQNLSAGAHNEGQTLWRAQAGVGYEADLFGRVDASEQAATAGAQQSQTLFQSLRLALQADVAQVYFLIRELDAEAELYRDTLALRDDSLRLIERRYNEGYISEMDVARARTELAVAQSEALAIARRRASAEHALAVLLGKAPAEFAFAPSPLAPVAIYVPPGLPSSLLERRPDVAAAERAMAAANARVGVARAAFFPRLNITGSIGTEASQVGELFDWSSRTFLLGPIAGTILSLPIFDGGRRDADLERARAAYEEDVAAYRQTVLTAFREVEDNLASVRILADQAVAQGQAVAAAQRAANLSRIQYDAGSVNYLDVMDADRSVLAQRRAEVQLAGERARSSVGLIRALGGGWETSSGELASAAP